MSETLQGKCDAWNARYKVGQAVTVRQDSGYERVTKTSSPASVLSGHTAVIWLDGISGCYLLDRVKAVQP